MGTIRTSANAASLAFLLAAALPQAASSCEKASSPPIVQLRVTQPLILTPDGDVSLKVQMQADGCITVHYPSYDVRAGTYAYQLQPAEFDRLREEINGFGLVRFDPDAVRSELKRLADTKRRSGGPAVVHHVSDQEVIELAIEGQTKSATGAGNPAIVWTGLNSQLLNHPEHVQLRALKTLRDRLVELGSDPRMSKVEAR